jgi:hypothetical protein
MFTCQEFEEIIDNEGAERITTLMQKVIVALEHLELLVQKNDTELMLIEDLRYRYFKKKSLEQNLRRKFFCERKVGFRYSYVCTYDLYEPVCNVFDACRSFTRASGRGWGPGNREFLGPVKWLRTVPIGECHLGPKELYCRSREIR